MIDLVKKVLKDLIAIDTTKSSGCETNAALYLKRLCDEYGIYSELIESVKGKGNLVAYLPGEDPFKSNLLLHAHLDTEDTGDITRWKYHPLSGIEVQGHIYGRGALDCKGLVCLWISLLIYFKKNDIRLERGIVFAATADEENGGFHGTAWLLRNNRLVADCKYVIGEGGGFHLTAGGKSYVACQTGERGRIKYMFTGCDKSGFSSNKREFGNPLMLISRGLIKEKALNITSMDYMRRSKTEAVKKIENHNFCKNIFILEGEAGNTMDVSFLYKVPEASIRKKIAKIIGVCEQQLQLMEFFEPEHSICGTELWKCLQDEVRNLNPVASIVPFISPGYSDNRLFRKNEMITYGFFPLQSDDFLGGIHGFNECIKINSLNRAFLLLSKILFRFCAFNR